MKLLQPWKPAGSGGSVNLSQHPRERPSAAEKRESEEEEEEEERANRVSGYTPAVCIRRPLRLPVNPSLTSSPGSHQNL